MTPLNVLSLFAGVGGFDLGLERTGGFRTVAFCERDPFCRRVLKKHWPEVPCYDDVRDLTVNRLAADGISVDAIIGGFPCQDVSLAGAGAGLAGERSGLWFEFARLIRQFRPCLVLVENVAALRFRGLGDILGQLAALGYDAEWHCIPAGNLGAPHERDRLWIIAYTDEAGLPEREILARMAGEETGDAWRKDPSVCAGWAPEPDVLRVVHGVPGRVDRIAALGNAIVPQVPELIGRAILNAQVAA